MQALTRPLCACILAFPAFAAAQPLTFSKMDYSSAPGTRAIVAADFDRDGWTDVAQAGLGTNSVQVLLNARDGRLRHAVDVAVGKGPFAVAVEDLNLDGVPDLAVANADSHSISILLGRGDGRFTRSDIPSRTASPRGLATGDLNGDGKPDLVVSGYGGRAIVILFGDGAGAFAAGSTLAYTSQPHGVGIADFNHDGHVDVAVAHHSAEGLVLWSGSASGFLPAPVKGAANLNLLAVGDVNADGWMDIVAAGTYTGRIAIYLGAASGMVYARGYRVDADPRGIALDDLNRDGALDVIVANRGTSSVNVLPGDPSHPGAFLPRLSFPAGMGSRAVAAADFDNDGRVDLALGNQYAAATSILENTTEFRQPAYAFARAAVPAETALARTGGFAAADVNRDGVLDPIQRVADSGDVAVVLSDGRTGVLPAPGPDASHVVGDFNGDGNIDVTHVSLNGLVTHLGDGRGRFGASPATLVWPGNACAAGETNQDGHLDLVCVAGTVMLGNGDGTFRVGPGFSPVGSVFAPRLADLDRDGRLDAAFPSGEVCFGDGEGGASSCRYVDNRWLQRSVAIADLNHDGYQDLVFSDGLTDFAVIPGAAAGFDGGIAWSFSEGLAEWTHFTIADIDVDGHQDIVINGLGGNDDSGGVMRVLPGLGDGTFGPVQAFALSAGEIVVADVTKDGLPDVLAAAGVKIDVLVNQPGETNRPPLVAIRDVASDRLGCIRFAIEAIDPDQHALSIEWSGEVSPEGRVGRLSAATTCIDTPGRHPMQLSVSDNRGGVVSRSFTVSVVGPTEIVLHMTGAVVSGRGEWAIVADASGAGGVRAYNRNLGAPKVTSPAAHPAGFVELSFLADPSAAYKLWVRLKADGDHWANDSIWVQFSGATDPSGRPMYRIGSTSALAVNLEECANCGVSGWGWEDDGWGGVNRNGVLLRFPGGGLQRMRIQTREDGVSIDQVVLSAARYLTARPGAARNDATIHLPSGRGPALDPLVHLRCQTTGCSPGTTLIQASDGWFYGMTSEDDGLGPGDGTIFRMNRAGSLELLPLAGSLSLSFFDAGEGVFYGVGGEDESSQGPNVIFRMDLEGRVTILHEFDVGGATALVKGRDGFVYGLSWGTGASGAGTVFRMDSTGVVTVLRSLDDPGLSPMALFEASDGFFYGTTYYGTVFRLDRAGGITVLHSFASVYVDLMQASDGFFYGTTSEGGAAGNGTVFRMDSAGHVTVLHSFDGATGGSPILGPIEARDGYLYGMTPSGGAFGFGTIYRMDRAGAVMVLHSFTGADGATPVAALTEGRDDVLYGTTASGGAYGQGAVFRFVPPPH